MRYLLVVLIIILYAAFCIWCRRRYQQKHAQAIFTAAIPALTTNPTTPNTSDSEIPKPWLVAYASQTGHAEALAMRTAQQLSAAGVGVSCLALNQLQPHTLTKYQQLLWVVSTYGEGEAPDNGARFITQLAGTNLTGMRYAILALGDSSYKYFCAFGHQLHHALQHAGAKAACDLIEVDKNDAGALRHWQYYLGQLSDHSDFVDWQKPAYEQWQLIERRQFNAGSSGAPVYFLRLIPLEGECHSMQWTAGDIVEIGPHNDANFPHREYSIASTPAEGSLDLLVRQVRKNDGRLGLGSGWLTHHAKLDAALHLRIRTNRRFHPPAANIPLILIGNGTGIAGLRAHLFARIAVGRYQNWLLFGERNAAYDAHFDEQLSAWLARRQLARLDRVFSRDASTQARNQPRYVQHLLLQAEAELKQWLAQGAAIYVCGSLQGMAQGVDQALADIIGRQALEDLNNSGRYCRDVY